MDFKNKTVAQIIGTLMGQVAAWFLSAVFIWWVGTSLRGISVFPSLSTWKSLPCAWL